MNFSVADVLHTYLKSLKTERKRQRKKMRSAATTTDKLKIREGRMMSHMVRGINIETLIKV